jgi:hypothetical protein
MFVVWPKSVSVIVETLVVSTSGSFDVSNDTNADHWRGLDDGDCLNNLLLVDLGAGSISLADNVGHTGLEAEETGQVDGLGRVVLRESLDLTAVAGRALLGVEPHGAVTRRRKLTMRLKEI